MICSKVFRFMLTAAVLVYVGVGANGVFDKGEYENPIEARQIDRVGASEVRDVSFVPVG